MISAFKIAFAGWLGRVDKVRLPCLFRAYTRQSIFAKSMTSMAARMGGAGWASRLT